jgi:UDP-N-acetylmuramyl pentapeptide phosphotransferase/UDP-N-acetylglucosamine-1-phosphate transferase
MLPGAGLLAWIVSFFVIGLAGTWLARRYAMHRRLIDEPGERRSHAVATPRGGGISIVAALLLASLALAGWQEEGTWTLPAGAFGLLLVATAGWLDDHRPLSAGLRLLVHAIAAAILAVAVFEDSGSTVFACLVLAATLVLVNVWNFMDGIDGLAATQAIIVAIGYALVAGAQPASLLAVALAAATSGFLPFNFPKARIFLGDVGSGSLGFGLAMILALIISGEEETGLTVQFALLLPLSAFMVDASLTLGKRIVQRKRWWKAHVEHAYQRWAARSNRHVGVTIAFATWTLLGVGLMSWMQSGSAAYIMAVVIAWYLLAVLSWIWLQGRHQAPSEGRNV